MINEKNDKFYITSQKLKERLTMSFVRSWHYNH